MAVIDQHQRVVGDGVRLDFQRARGGVQQVHRGPRHLWLAADAIGVLDARVAVAVAFADFRTCHQRTLRTGHRNLARMAAQGVNGVFQRCSAAHDRVSAERAGDNTGRRIGPSAPQPHQRAGGGKLRAVDQRQTFLRAQRDRLQPGSLQRVAPCHAGAVKDRLALADHHGGHMRQWRKVARGTDRALIRDHRVHAFGQHPLDQSDRGPCHTRRPAPQRQQLQHHHQPRGRRIQRRADATAMRQDQIALQARGVLGGDLDRGKFAKASVHAVNRRLARRRLGHQCRRRFDAGAGIGGQRRSPPVGPDVVQGRQCRRAGCQDNGHNVPPKMRE